ncbi:hypothetical protein JQ596_34760 [Bradyrhizobium manausense]|uniref:hypothetical protein n=1 Tax=Bradyrhizobium TaxID=374 RepID=UPI001BAADBD3|nr:MULTISPECIES: hypothetical protein [Bradyrhizobium]MBR0830681.1 hypothetical protein [Bradyrhizobium manausense]UVO31060.1 hypothetical protein KUF59_10645 [Bradyrhizobium arachidis]
MRFVVLPLALLTSAAAAAEPVDCDAIANTMAPVELTYHDGDNSSVAHVYRDQSGNSVVWIKTLDGKFVAKGVFVAGILATGETTSAYAGKFKSSKIKYTVEGMPRLFDRRSDLKYSITHSTVYGDGSTDVSTTTYSYKFKSAGKEAVGPCMLDVVHGESDTVNEKTGKTAHTYGVYFPQLMTGMTGKTAEPVLDDIKTKFDPMTMIP